MFSSTVLGFLALQTSVVYFELIFVQGEREEPCLSLLPVNIAFPALFIEDTIFPLQCILLASLLGISWLWIPGLLSVNLCPVPWIDPILCVAVVVVVFAAVLPKPHTRLLWSVP